MGMSLITDADGAAQQAQEFWSPLFVDELLETAPYPALVNRDYDGDLKKGGDTVYVSQIDRIQAQRKTVGAGHESFNSQKQKTTRVAVIADQVLTAAVEMDDLIDLQSQLGDPAGQSKIRQELVNAMNIELNKYLYDQIAPSASAPDHTLTGVTDFNATQLLNVRKLASQAKWLKSGGWWGLLDPSYYNDLLNAQTLTAQNETGADAPRVGGQFVNQRFGFNLLEDNSEGLLQLSSSSEDAGIFFHPDHMILVMQQMPTFQVSSLHSNKEHGFLVSVKMVVGAKQGPDGDKKVISVINA
jgi:hypothetical protein